jgi:hypothetical protein
MIYDFDKSTFICSTNFFTCMARIWNSVRARFFTDIRILNIFWARMRMYINTYKETNKVYNPTSLIIYDFDKSTFICSIAKVKKIFHNAFVGLKKSLCNMTKRLTIRRGLFFVWKMHQNNNLTLVGFRQKVSLLILGKTNEI